MTNEIISFLVGLFIRIGFDQWAAHRERSKMEAKIDRIITYLEPKG